MYITWTLYKNSRVREMSISTKNHSHTSADAAADSLAFFAVAGGTMTNMTNKISPLVFWNVNYISCEGRISIVPLRIIWTLDASACAHSNAANVYESEIATTRHAFQCVICNC